MSAAVAIGNTVVARTAADGFFAQLADASRRVLLLDYDGTIAPFSVHRNRAFPYPTIPELLDCIMSTCRTRVAVITGRVTHEIPPLLGLRPHPEIWGTHGMERLHADGRYRVSSASAMNYGTRLPRPPHRCVKRVWNGWLRSNRGAVALALARLGCPSGRRGEGEGLPRAVPAGVAFPSAAVGIRWWIGASHPDAQQGGCRTDDTYGNWQCARGLSRR